MLSDIVSTYGERLVIAVVGVGLAFIALIVVLWLVRRRGGPAPFLKGGRNRQPRLQVLDATAVDARRRLVLVRRDNVEHLIMIGGPTDIVVESGIGAIPFVTDITNDNQASLNDLRGEAPQQQEPAISAPAPQIAPAKREELKVEQEIKLEEEPVKAAPVALPTAPIAVPQKREPEPVKEVITPAVAPATATLAPKATAPQPAQAQPTLAKPAPFAVTPPLPSAGNANEASKPSSPLMTSAMRPRAATAAVQPQLQPQSPIAAPFAAAAATASVTAAASQTPVTASAISEAPLTATASLEPDFTRRVDDIFDTARERVLPDLKAEAKEPNAEPAFDDSFSAELRDDFESFLNAEMEKNSQASAADEALGTYTAKPMTSEVDAPITGASIDRDAQKEMARIFGEMAVKRD